MSATDTKRKPDAAPNPDTATHRHPNPSYTIRVICCVLFIFITEICLAHYIYRLINSEMRSDYLSKQDFRQYFLTEIRSDGGKDEISRIFRELSQSSLTRSRRSAAASSSSNYNVLNLAGDEPFVEFFPEKREPQDPDEDVRQRAKGSGDPSWVWVTSSSRIPEKALEGYCKKVHQFCLPVRIGPIGPPGVPGPKGDRGDKGFPGVPGQMGNRGLPGLPGEKGVQGRSGLDGRDGIPGEPGLDGLPGRNGHDGLPGLDGMPGTPGKNGNNGLDGRPGLPGPKGAEGPQGLKGLTGPRGRPGKPGNHGTPGIPGISAYKLKGNVSDFLVPPSIAGHQPMTPMGPIVVHEGENVRMHCSAAGKPVPHITWQKVGKRPINRGSWQDVSIAGATLNLTRVHRDHMGLYLCIADNGIPPQVNQTFSLEVYFPPLVRIRNQAVPVTNGSTAVLECETEAFPEPLRYWERSDGRLLENGTKYKIYNSVDRNGYKARMQLLITGVSSNDLQYLYYCVCKNELQITKGEFQLHETDPRKPGSHQTFDTGKPAIYGVQAPDKVALEDLCQIPPPCPKCDEYKDLKCSAGVSLIDLISRWEIRKFGNKQYSGNLTRSMDCVLYAVGKPVYHRSTDDTYGCWMRDSHPAADKHAEKFWATKENDSGHLYEYDNKTAFRKDSSSKTYNLQMPFQGNAHVIYNGAFYYHLKNSVTVVKFDLATNNYSKLELAVPYKKNMTKLYTGQYNYLDFSVDDNGLWVIFPVPDSNNTAIMKTDVVLMQPQYIWNVSINHHKVGEMFVVCGVLYAVDSVTDRNTLIRFALDLYKNKLLDVNLTFSNPFRKTTMIAYNYKNKELYTWDRGNQLTYPVRYHEIGYNYTSKEDRNDLEDKPIADMQTGYDVYV